MATHPNTLAWEIPWMEKPGRPQFMGLRRAGHSLMTKEQQRPPAGMHLRCEAAIEPGEFN